MIIYRKSDRVSVEIEGIEFKLSPLTFQEKSELQQHMIKAVRGDMDEAMISVRKSIKYCLKDMKGVFYIDESGDKREYHLGFEDNVLSDDCIDDLLNMPISAKLNSVCAAMLHGVPEEILGEDGKPVEGIKIKKQEEKKPGKSQK